MKIRPICLAHLAVKNTLTHRTAKNSSISNHKILFSEKKETGAGQKMVSQFRGVRSTLLTTLNNPGFPPKMMEIAFERYVFPFMGAP